MRDASLYASRFQASPTDRAPPRAPRRKGRRSLLGQVFGARGIGATLILGIAVVAAIGVPMNALFFQDGRHPAPLFSSTPPIAVVKTPTPPARPTAIEPPRQERAESPAPRRPANDAIADKIEKADAVKSAPTKPEPPRGADKKKDPIGQLIVGQARPAPAKVDKAPPAPKNVLYTQRALLKLGYVVRADGVLTPATRQAFQKFERDVGLPVTAQITPKLLQQLAARSRLPPP